MKREDVEALYQEARENGGSIGHVDSTHLAALCRAWLAVDGGLRVYVGRVYDCDVGEDRGEIIRTLPESMIGFVRIVKEVG